MGNLVRFVLSCGACPNALDYHDYQWAMIVALTKINSTPLQISAVYARCL